MAGSEWRARLLVDDAAVVVADVVHLVKDDPLDVPHHVCAPAHLALHLRIAYGVPRMRTVRVHLGSDSIQWTASFEMAVVDMSPRSAAREDRQRRGRAPVEHRAQNLGSS